MKNGPLTEIDKVLMGVRYSRQKALASMDGSTFRRLRNIT
jgi:hypothetical protein